MDTSYIGFETLEEHITCLFKGTFYDKDDKKVGVIMVLDTFFNIPKEYSTTLALMHTSSFLHGEVIYSVHTS